MDWESSNTSVLLNPRMDEDVQAEITNLLPMEGDFLAHVWMLTSGSTAEPNEYKCVALSKDAILASAKAVNKHVGCEGADRWLCCLPQFHVGGLGIKARGYLSGAKVFDFKEKWDATVFAQQLVEQQITLTSLVPAQVFDLIRIKAVPPQSLRAVIVGGGAMGEVLYQQSLGLGWPVLPSYGLTEAASSVATAKLESKDSSLHLLDHIELKVDSADYLQIKSPSLLSAYAYVKDGLVKITDPKIDGWLKTEDKGEVFGRNLQVWGRGTNFIKVGGESVDLGRLEKMMEGLIDTDSPQSVVLLAMADQRLGHVVHVAVEGKVNESTRLALDNYQKQVLPFERYRQVHEVKQFPRSPLGKILKQKILSSMCRS